MIAKFIATAALTLTVHRPLVPTLVRLPATQSTYVLKNPRGNKVEAIVDCGIGYTDLIVKADKNSSMVFDLVNEDGEPLRYCSLQNYTNIPNR